MTTENDTPAADWREFGDKDPHGTKYQCRRSDLPYGDFTDDQIANAVFICDHRASLESIGLLEAAKARIRWLSRQNEAKAERIKELEQTTSNLEAVLSAADSLIERWTATGGVIIDSPEDKAVMRRFRDAISKAKETTQ